MLRSFARRACVPALAALALGVLAVPASASTVVGGGLDWRIDNFFASGDPQRTWLGYVTGSSGPGAANGTATATGGAAIADRTGATVGEVTPASPRGVGETYRISFPATGGTYDEHSGTGTIQLGGTITFTPHRATYSIPNPTLTLNGFSGSLAASGQAGRSAYGPEAPLFTFDLTSSLVTLKADGSREIGVLARASAGAFFFGPTYPPAQGTEAFALRLKLKPDEVRGPKGDKGDAGEPGKTVVLQTSVLRRAPFADGGKRHEIDLLTTKGKKVVASGAVRARTIRVRLADGRTKRLKGVFLLKAGDKTKRVRVL